MSDALAHVWAKSRAEGEREGEHLSAHTAHLLARLAGLRERNPTLGDRVGRRDVYDLAAWAVALHDVGKAALGFQAMLRDGPRFGHRHEVLSLALVGKLELDDESLGLVAAGVGTHHKNADWVRQSYPFGSQARVELLAELSHDDELAWEAWLSGGGLPRLDKLGFRPLPPRRALGRAEALDRGLDALERLLEQLEEHDAVAPLALAARSLRGLVVLADHAASAHERLTRAESLSAVSALVVAAGPRLGRGLEPHQAAASQTVGSALLVAPTGSGKTEAALLWAARQREASVGEPPLFYVLPYRASLDAMRARLPSYGLGEGTVVLQHASTTTSLYGQLLDKGYSREEAAKAARHERNLGKLMTAPVRVLTPYQLLRAFFGLPGHEAMLTDAAGASFILDELHAYEPSRLALILVAFRHLVRDLGARVLAMSATFPSVLVTLLDELFGGPVRIEADPATQARFRRHTLRVVEGDLESEGSLAEVATRFARGEAVLVVASTVARAQRLYDAVRAKVGADGVALLHGRFTGQDRSEKERALARRVGTGRRAEGEGGGTVLVATQVVEVSLDVDFDALFSDPAPIEALLQRFGRVNRGRRGGLREVVVHTAHPDEARRIYDEPTITRALAVLRPASLHPVDEAAVQGWVDAAYAPIAASWLATVRRYIDEHEEALVRTSRPLVSHPKLAEQFDQLFDGAEVVPACFADEHERRLRDDALTAPALRVPVSFGQRAMLKKKGLLALRGAGPSAFEIANVPYTAERGLDLKVRDDDA